MNRWGGLQDPALAHWTPTGVPPIPTESIGGLLRHRAQWRGDRPAIYRLADGRLEAMSHAQLLQAAENIAGWIAERCRPAERIAVWSRNSLEWVLLVHGSAMAGTIIVPFNTAWTPPEVDHALKLTTPSIAFVGLDHAGRPLDERMPEDADCLVEPMDSLAGIARTPNVYPLPEVTQDAPFLIQFTSGTTGRAKGVLLSQRAMVLGGWLRPFTEQADESSVFLNALPYHHVGGTSTVILGGLGLGGAYVVMDRFASEVVAKLIRELPPTLMSGVPTMLQDLLASPDLPPDARVRSVLTGGASVPPELVRQLSRRFGATCGIAYGQSEAPIATSTLPDDPEWVICETIGRPLPLIEIRIADPDGDATMPLDSVGEIRIKGPTVMERYWNDERATAEAFDPQGFLRTGDLGSMDADGIMRFRGRCREVIIRGGENVYPAEIENALAEHADVVRAAAVGVEDARLGHVVGAVVQLAPGALADAGELTAFLRPRLARFKLPVHWTFVADMPMTASGKVRKADLAGVFAGS